MQMFLRRGGIHPSPTVDTQKSHIPSCIICKNVVNWISLLEIKTVLEAFMRFPFPP